MEANISHKPRRILMTADTIGGVWTYTLELIRALAPHGIEVMLATMGTRLNKAQKKEVKLIPNLEIQESNFRLEWMQEPWPDVSLAGEWLLELKARWQPDVVHLNGYAHGSLPWHAPVLVVGHSCVLSWWKAVKHEHAPFDYNRYREAVTQGLRAANLVVAPSQAMLQELKEHYGPLSSSEVIPNGRNPEAFKPSPKKELILTAGRLWDEAKNIKALTMIAPALAWPVYVAGEEKHPDGFGTEHKHVQLLGRLSHDELAPWFAQASIYALPARYEPFGLSALEAGLADCALVLGDIPSLREIWGEAALFVAPDDTEALKAALNKLISDRAMLNEYASRAQSRASEFSPQKMAKRYVSAYAGLIRNHLSTTKEQLACAS
ncbi:MAG: glycosyl transferase family 1 [Pedosphaera sp.]|nr:glycosyl transferase family 1 [Pedosphaera sp.]